MTLLEVAKHALEAMEDAMYRADTHEFYDAKESLRYAIEQAEQQEPVAWMDIDDKGQKHGLRYYSDGSSDEVPLYTAPTPQPEQPHDLLCVCGAEWDIYSDGREELVAAPTPRKPLTDLEILAANKFMYNQHTCVYIQEDGEPENLIAFARAIERAHGITGDSNE